MKKLIIAIVAVHMMIAVLVLPSSAQGVTPPIRVMFLVPTHNEDHTFWSEYIAFMEAAAEDFGMQLDLVRVVNRYEALDAIKRVAARPESREYLVCLYYAQSAEVILEMTEKAGIKTVISNTDVVPNERVLVGGPRTRFKQWIGHIYPDDRQASELLTTKLVKSAEKLGLASIDHMVRAVGIGGSRDTAVSAAREAGFLVGLSKMSNALFVQYVLSEWDNDLAYKKALGLLRRYPEVPVYWTASDDVSLKVQQAMRNVGLVPGRDGVTGGFDWTRAGIKAVGNGSMEATVGGHFMEGAWALTLIYDYHHGNDFVSQGATFRSQMRLIDRDNMKTYLPVLDRKNWGKIDFKRFTRTHNPAMKEYDFSPDAVVRALADQ